MDISIKTLHGSFAYEGEPFRYHVEFTPKPRVEHKKTAYAYLIHKFPQLKGLKPLSVEIYSYEIDEEAIKENISKGGSSEDVITKEHIIYQYPAPEKDEKDEKDENDENDKKS